MQRVWAGQNDIEAHSAIMRWVSQHSFGHPDNVWDNSSSYGVLRGGVPIAGVVYHDFKPSAGTVQYSGAATDPRWLQGPSLHFMFSYMFDDLGCQTVLTGNSAGNKRLHRLLERTGHKKNIIERAWDRETDMFLWTLSREQWLENDVMKRSRAWTEGKPNV